ncbi:MAG: YIP1 family protein [Thermoflexales bacterium]|nr:YIP1 family protein [Thermoflexales bacterium]
MAEATANVEELIEKPLKPWQFKWLGGMLFKPRATLTAIRAVDRSIWLMPILIVLALLTLRVIVNAPLKLAALEQGAPVVDPNNQQFLTPEQQAQMQQALEATKGPVFLYVFPIVGALISGLLLWSMTAALLHLFSTLQGGRGTLTRTLNLVAWASVPTMIHLLVQIIYISAAGKLIAEPGLAGFAAPSPDGSVLVHALLSRVDVYLFWQIALLLVGVQIFTTIKTRKALTAVVVTMVIMLAVRILPEVVGASLGGVTVGQSFPLF